MSLESPSAEGAAAAPDLLADLERRAQRHDVAATGGSVAWRRFGAGPHLVLLHGGHGSWHHWLRNIAALERRHTLWVPDMPGYGASTPPPEPTLASLVEALRCSLDALVGPATPVDVAGFSFGGLVATHLSVQRGAVRRLALLGPAGHGGARRPRGELQNWREAHRSGDAAALRAVMRHNLMLHMLHDETAADETALHVHVEACLATRFHRRSISRAGGLLPMLDRFAGPTLLLWGEHDVTATPQALLPQLLAGHPNRQGEVLAGAGHWVAYEAADRVQARMLAFLAT